MAPTSETSELDELRAEVMRLRETVARLTAVLDRVNEEKKKNRINSISLG